MTEKPSITISQMIVACGEEANRIRAMQGALIKAGIRDDPADSQILKADVFEYTSNFLARLSPYADDIRAMLSERPGNVSRALRGGGNGRRR